MSTYALVKFGSIADLLESVARENGVTKYSQVVERLKNYRDKTAKIEIVGLTDVNDSDDVTTQDDPPFKAPSVPSSIADIINKIANHALDSAIDEIRRQGLPYAIVDRELADYYNKSGAPELSCQLAITVANVLESELNVFVEITRFAQVMMDTKDYPNIKESLTNLLKSRVSKK